MRTEFTRLNQGWDAEPNAPDPTISVDGRQLVLSFFLNPWQGSNVRVFDRGELIFQDCWRYRLGETNDEGWYKKQCRFSLVAPEWGKFYQVCGVLRLQTAPNDWIPLGTPASEASHHFLFYFRDETFECDAKGWSVRTLPIPDADLERIRSVARTVTLQRGSWLETFCGFLSAPYWLLRRIRARIFR